MVNAQIKRVEIPTYVPYPADTNPIFFQNRNIQGAGGKIFPMAMRDRLGKAFQPVGYQQITLENEYIDVALLPEIGGRIYSALDKGNGYDFIYRNRVIKPQLIGLCGPWVSGGIEFNWPQHHRPTTFMPVAYAMETNDDGSVTAWMGEVEPLNRTKGMVGITVHPGKSYIEAKIRLFNRTYYTQTFLWWANLAVAVNENYRAVFPEDIHWASDHAWALTSAFPVIEGLYKTIDFGSGVDVRDFPNMPLPTSFFTYNSQYDFLSGYDFGKHSGIVHIADRHIGTGKKMFTWGVSDYSRAWFDNLTDEDGPYIELMTGVYSCNQPDFAWMAPHEYKTAKQYWYPIREIGEVKSATLDGAIGVAWGEGMLSFSLNTTQRWENAKVIVRHLDTICYEKDIAIAPDRPFHGSVPTASGERWEYEFSLYSLSGEKLVSYRPEKPAPIEVPAPLTAAPAPEALNSTEELYLHALHIWQYRHPYFSPVAYLRRALEIDPKDIRCNTLLGKILMDQGAFAEAEQCFKAAVARSVTRNCSPYDVEPYYQLGVLLRLTGRDDDAYERFFKAVWGHAWKSSAFCALSEIDAKRGKLSRALEHCQQAVWANAANFKAVRLKASLLRNAGKPDEGLAALSSVLSEDKLDYAAVYEQYLLLTTLGRDTEAAAALNRFHALTMRLPENILDVAIDYGDAGMYREALSLLFTQAKSPVCCYYAAFYQHALGNAQGVQEALQAAADADIKGCLHCRLSSIAVFRFAMQNAPCDAKAPYLLGNIYYHKDQFDEAIACFQASVDRNADFPTAYRNLAIGIYDHQKRYQEAGPLMEKAFRMDPKDHRVFYELMQYYRNTGMPVAKRLRLLELHADLVSMRDDLYTKAISTYIEAGNYEKAIDMLNAHEFHPYEGGEGVLTGEHIAAHHLLGAEKLRQGNASEALDLFKLAAKIPENYHEGKRPMRYEHAHLDYYLGLAYEAMGDRQAAEQAFSASTADESGSPDMLYYTALSLRHLGQETTCREKLKELLRTVDTLLKNDGNNPYFTKSLVYTLPFEHDNSLNNKAHCAYLQGLAHKARNDPDLAEIAFRDALRLKPTNYMAKAMLKDIRQTLER